MISINILKNFIKKNNYLVILKKLLKRFENNDSQAATEWAKQHALEDTDEWMKKNDLKLYLETKEQCEILEKDAQKILSDIKEYVSGGAAYELLYYLTKKKKPKVIVETGVAAGWSTLAFLRASENNKSTRIYSSDFPLFRNKNPEQNIGILTKNEKNKEIINLFIEGDETNLPLIVKKLNNKKIDLFHFDSDKSYSGRDFCVKVLGQHFSKDAILIFDDIYNNFHFRDFVEKNNFKFKVLKYKQGFLGIIDFHLNY